MTADLPPLPNLPESLNELYADERAEVRGYATAYGRLCARQALERARNECAAARKDYPITGALYSGRCEDRIDAIAEEYK